MRSYTLTLTNADTVYKLQTLLRAANSAEREIFGRYKITADSANANPVLLGGPNLSTTVYGERLAANGISERATGSGVNDQSTLGVYLLGVTTAGMKVHITVEEV